MGYNGRKIKMKKLAFLAALVVCSAMFLGCKKNGSGMNPTYDEVEKYIFGTWRLSQYVDENGNKKAEPIEVLYIFKKGAGYHDYYYSVFEAGEPGIIDDEFEIEPMGDVDTVEDDVVIYFPNDPSEQYLITQINSSDMRWQEVRNYNPKTKTEEGYIFTRVQ